MRNDKCGFASMPTIENLSSYESPIQIVCREMQNTFDSDVMKAVLNYGISVDKDELIRALQYDRDQYEKGFADGVHVNLGEDVVRVVRCKDCKHYNEDSLYCGMNSQDRGEWFNWYKEDFCSYGEKRSCDE